MVDEEIILLFSGGDHRFLRGAAFLCLGHGNCILYSLLSYDRRDHFSYADLGRSGFRSGRLLHASSFWSDGIQLLCTGIVGQYLSKTYLETKHRPIYIIKDSSEEEKGAAHVRESIWSKCGLDQSA